jgi:hypothetical protein
MNKIEGSVETTFSVHVLSVLPLHADVHRPTRVAIHLLTKQSLKLTGNPHMTIGLKKYRPKHNGKKTFNVRNLGMFVKLESLSLASISNVI